MKLTNFLDKLYGCQELPVLVYDDESYDAMWELVDSKTRMDKYGKEYGNAIFALHLKYTEYKVSEFLNEKYSNAEVVHFMVTDECMLVFINVIEQVGNPDR